MLSHAATSQVTADTTADQIRYALRDIPADPGSNRLPDVLQAALDTARVLERLAKEDLRTTNTAAEDMLRARIAELETALEEMTIALANEKKAKDAAQEKLKAGGVWANYKSATGKTMGVGQFALARTGIPATVLYFLGANHPLVVALLKLLS